MGESDIRMTVLIYIAFQVVVYIVIAINGQSMTLVSGTVYSLQE